MDGLYFILLLALAFGLIFGIPIAFSIILHRRLKRRVNNKISRTITLIPLLVLLFFLFKACNPSDSYYKEDFVEITNLNFPESGKIKYKKASFPDHHGDYTSCSMIEFNETDYKFLLDTILFLGYEEKENEFTSEEHKIILKKIKDKNIYREFVKEDGGAYFLIQFLSDKKSIIALRISW